MPVDERTRQPFGILHGGASVALAETVASVGAYELVDKEIEAVAGQEINANHVRPKTEGIVTAIGTVLHQGKTTRCGILKLQTSRTDLFVCPDVRWLLLKKEIKLLNKDGVIPLLFKVY